MRHNNKGLSFVEIIIVVAIMGVLVGVAGFGIGMVSGRPAEECAQKLTYALQRSRTSSMGQLNAQYMLTRDATTNEVILIETVDNPNPALPAIVTTTVLGNRDVTVEYDLDDGSHYSIDTTPLQFTFTRDTGAFNPVNGLAAYCTSITVSRTTVVRTIEIAPFTGRVALQ